MVVHDESLYKLCSNCVATYPFTVIMIDDCQ